VRKPTRQIYERVIGMTQADPASSVFVDDREQNLAPARALGMQTIHFTNARGLAQSLAQLGFDV
jgi:putative hydrolase of the HAD superfamily